MSLDPVAEWWYRLGYHDGYEVGHGAAVHEVYDRAEWLAGRGSVGHGPSHFELLRRRGPEAHGAGCNCLDCQRYARELVRRGQAT